MEYEASFRFDERLEVKKLCKVFMYKVDCLLQHIAHMAQNVVRHCVCETVIATSSELDIGLTWSKYCRWIIN